MKASSLNATPCNSADCPGRRSPALSRHRSRWCSADSNGSAAPRPPSTIYTPSRTASFLTYSYYSETHGADTSRPHFEDTAIAIITERGGTVVKTVGDEVLFVANTPDVAADLSTTFHQQPTTPPLRIGLATGPVVRHLGDVFGTTVNLASRLTTLAAPDSVLVSPSVAATLADDSRYDLRRLREVHIRGIGPLTPLSLTRHTR